jgi:predicted hotdog family 3-hydroxylacyl-ACP dehydratase
MKFADILEYIPQRPPFVMIDELIEVTDQKTVSTFRPTDKNLFAEDGKFYEGGIIENIAQTIAAGAGYRLREAGLKPKMGVIGSIRKLKISELPEANNQLKTRIQLITDIGNAIVVKGEVDCNGKMIASCQMNVFIIDQPQELTN